MKKIFNSIGFILFAAVLIISSCHKSKNLIDENNKFIFLDSANSANIKVIQVFAGNKPQLPTAPHDSTGPQVFIYANGKKLNGSALSYGAAWPTTNNYGNIPAGSTRFDIINARLDLTVVPNVPKFIAGDTLATFTVNLDKGKYYSLYIGDTVPAVRVTVKEDILIAPDYQTYKLRVANFSMNVNDTFSLFSARQNAVVISDISHKNVSNWVQLPLPIIGDTLKLFKKGTTTVYAQANGFIPVGLRMYTILARGKTGVKNKREAVSIIINR